MRHLIGCSLALCQFIIGSSYELSDTIFPWMGSGDTITWICGLYGLEITGFIYF